ncbi:hypothetical protein FFF34_003165 [Inquilinus sp. KBS0705]|nr:hypothetical protein FFF34_003165 [Inquilinus sp. KBS0705]
MSQPLKFPIYNNHLNLFPKTTIMYDDITFKLLITNQQYAGLNKTLRSLNNVITREYQNTGIITIQTTYQDCFFSLSPKYLTVAAKLPKLLYGTNQVNFTLREAKLAISKIQEILCINIGGARVSRVDLAYNLVMDQPVENYFKFLCNKDGMKRWTASNESLYFKSKSGTELNFYNKTAHLKDTAQEILAENIDANLLRYEYRVKSGLAKIVDYHTVTVDDLMDDKFYKLMRELWYDAYKTIDKLSYTPAATRIRSVPELKNYLMLDSIDRSGAPATYDLINSLSFQVSARVKYNMRKMLKSLISNPAINDANDAVAELDSKMLNVFQYAA